MGNWHSKNKKIKDVVIYVALFDYDARTDEDLPFKSGDHLIILDNMEFDWWQAKHKENGKTGFIPSNFVAKLGSLECEP